MFNALIGGSLIGLSVSMMLLFNGKITGISGILGGIMNRKNSDKSWRIIFIAGLISGGMLLKLFYSASVFSMHTNANHFDYILAGFLVGFGTLLGNGCTSGHGVCGISRLSLRSIVATLTFIASGVLSVVIFKLVRGEL